MPYLPRERVIPEMKVCRQCRKEKPARAFSPARQNVDGLHSYCKPCCAERHAARRAARTPERRQAELVASRSKETV